jgi:hypothetical protein
LAAVEDAGTAPCAGDDARAQAAHAIVHTREAGERGLPLDPRAERRRPPRRAEERSDERGVVP